VEEDVILSTSVIEQLHELSAYNVTKSPRAFNEPFWQMLSLPDPWRVDLLHKMREVSEVRNNDGDDIEHINDNSRVDQIDNDLNAITNANFDTVADHVHAKSTSAVLLAEQQADPSLDHAWSLAKRSKSGFFVKDHLLYQKDRVMGQTVEQLCLPEGRRREICHLAHDLTHQGHKRTKEKLSLNFYWEEWEKP